MTLHDDYALILEGASRLRLDLAKDLLEGAGIPTIMICPTEAEMTIHAPPLGLGDIYVPKKAREDALALLNDAWGPGWRARN